MTEVVRKRIVECKTSKEASSSCLGGTSAAFQGDKNKPPHFKKTAERLLTNSASFKMTLVRWQHLTCQMIKATPVYI